MNMMGKRPRTFSTLLEWLPYTGKGFTTYFYALKHELVFVCFEHMEEPYEELISDFGEGTAFFMSENGERESPLKNLGLCCSNFILKAFVFEKEKPICLPDYHLVYVTNNKLLNLGTVSSLALSSHVTVIDDFDQVPADIAINPKETLPGADYVKAYYQMGREGWELSPEDQEKGKEPVEIDWDSFVTTINQKDNSNVSLSELLDIVKETNDDDDDDLDLDDDDDDEDDKGIEQALTAQRDQREVKVQILEPLENPKEELKRLVGCADIKKKLVELTNLTLYNKMLKEIQPSGRCHAVPLHSVFYGRPGTGKTTVCKIFGSLLKEAGALSKGHVVVCNRGTFIGCYWGDEERSVNKVVELAKGGVLMIDEAYMLDSNGSNDPGRLVLPLLMDLLADEQMRDIAVVLCGYKEPMDKLLELNQGLESRFPNRFEFTDFTLPELLSITLLRVKEYNYHFTPAAWQKYKMLLEQAYRKRDPEKWGNARFVANQLDRIYMRHAGRCVRSKRTDKATLLSITKADIEPISVPAKRKAIGF